MRTSCCANGATTGGAASARLRAGAIRATAYRAGQQRHCQPARPTALVAALALVPLTLDKSAAGKEILYPVAVVILGGLLSSTLLDIVVTPVVFRLLGQRALAQYRANHAETGLSAPGTAVDAPPFTPPADQDALSPAR